MKRTLVRIHDPAAVARARRRMLPAAADAVIRPLSDALCDPVRFKIATALSAADLSVKDLAVVVGRSQSTTSQHLRVLRQIGAVVASRQGRRVVYSLAEGGIGAALVSLLDAVQKVAS
jgi:DNA-binding transcriptional ArsR family regulator